MKKLLTFLLVAFATITFFAQSSKGQTTYHTIFLDNYTIGANVPYCASSCDSIKIVSPTGMINISWFASGASMTLHGDTLVLPTGFGGINGQDIICNHDQGYDLITLHTVSPHSQPVFGNTTICGIETVLLDAENYSQWGFTSYLWSNGATTQTITVGAGTYSVTITNVCGSITHSATITESNLNAPDLGPDIITCHGDSVALDPGTGYSTYSWFPAITTDSVLYATSGGIYVVQTTNAVGGCVDRDTILVTFLMPTGNNICYVEFDTITLKNRIIWGTPPLNAANINIYSEISAGVYSLIGTLPHTQTSFIDMGSNPQNMSNSYKIAVIDTCGNESSQSAHHKTITLLSTYDQLSNTYGFTWSSYEGLSVANYFLYGLTASNQAMQIGSVPGNSYFYNYSNPSPLFVKYFVAFLSPSCGSKTDYLVKSNFVASITAGIEENEQEKVSIFPNPAQDRLYIQTQEIEFETEIINIFGQVVIQDSDKTEIDISALPSGTYILRLTGKAFSGQRSFIVY